MLVPLCQHLAVHGIPVAGATAQRRRELASLLINSVI